MNLEAAIAAFEADFLVSDEVGQDDPDNPNRRRMDRAPNGDRYVVVTSGGIRGESEGVLALFADAEDAAEAWLRCAWSYADKRGGKELFWAQRPVYEAADLVGIDQVAMLNSQIFRRGVAMCMGTVEARLVVSRSADRKEKG